MPLSPAFSLVSFDELPGWWDDDQRMAFEAFRRSAFHVLTKPYRTGSLGVAFDAFDAAYAEARSLERLDSIAARTFFERHFEPVLVSPEVNSLPAAPHSVAPPSVLPDISPTWGEIGSVSASLNPATLKIGETQAAGRSAPVWGRCPAGQRGA